VKFEIILVSCKDLRNDSLLVLFNLEFSKAHITSIMKTVCDIKIGPIFAIIVACRETAFMLPFIQLPPIKSYWPNPQYQVRVYRALCQAEVPEVLFGIRDDLVK